VDDVQYIVDLVATPAICRTMAGWAAWTQRPDAANAAGIPALLDLRGIAFSILRACGNAGSPPAGEAPCLARQIVEHAGKRRKPQGKARGVDRIVGRGRR
jgi:hypothetical protein